MIVMGSVAFMLYYPMVVAHLLNPVLALMHALPRRKLDIDVGPPVPYNGQPYTPVMISAVSRYFRPSPDQA